MAELEGDRALRTQRSRALTLLFLVSLFNYQDRYILGILLPSIKRDLSLSDTMLGLVTGVTFAIFYALASIPVGQLADRHPRRLVIGAALALWSAMTVLCGLSQNAAQLALARMVLGIGSAGATPPSHSLLADLYPPRSRGRALAIFSLGMPVGILLAFLIGGAAAGPLGWRTTLLLFGVPGLVLAAAAIVFLPDPHRAVIDPDAAMTNAPSLRRILAMLVRRRSFLHLCAGSGLYSAVWLGLLTWLPTFFTRGLGLSLPQTGAGLAVVLGGAQFLGLVAGGVLVDRMSTRDPRWPLWICAAGALLPLPFFVGALLTNAPFVAFILLFPAFLLAMLQGSPAITTVQSLAASSARSVTVAVYFVATNLIAGVGVQLIGILSDTLRPTMGPASVAIALLTTTTLLSAWAALHFWRGTWRLAADIAAAERDAAGGQKA